METPVVFGQGFGGGVTPELPLIFRKNGLQAGYFRCHLTIVLCRSQGMVDLGSDLPQILLDEHQLDMGSQLVIK